MLTLILMLSCAPKPAGPPEPVMPSTDPVATAGVSDPTLSTLLFEHWEAMMERWPIWATQVGDHRFDDKLPDVTPEGWAQTRVGSRAWLERVRTIDPDTLDESDRITWRVLEANLSDAIRQEVCANQEWQLSGFSNPFSKALSLADTHIIVSPEDGENFVARVSDLDAYIQGSIDTLRLGLADGRVATSESARRVLEMVEAELARPEESWALLKPALDDHPTWTEEQRASFHEALAHASRTVAIPAMGAFRDFMRDEVLPAARPDENAGVLHLPNGQACYEAAIAHHTSIETTAQALHDTGLSELESIHEEFRTLGDNLWGTTDLQAIFERLRTDPDLYFTTAQEVRAQAEIFVAQAKEAMPDFFGILPQADCIVTPIPDHQAAFSTIAYYRHANPDGSQPGQYFINLLDPETRPRHEAAVLAYHEAIPGHHLQITIAQEQGVLPAVRKFYRSTAYVEGWALYTERLADEMGLYADDLDRMGMLSYDAWRASRLVVDTGIHAFGWSREQAIRFMLDNTPLAPNNIDNEVDRYIGWPGQALAYKVGQIEMWRLRREAEATLGDDFDLRAWHDAILSVGAVPLPVLKEHMSRWLNAQK